jgi:hypothetical protein
VNDSDGAHRTIPFALSLGGCAREWIPEIILTAKLFTADSKDVPVRSDA